MVLSRWQAIGRPDISAMSPHAGPPYPFNAPHTTQHLLGPKHSEDLDPAPRRWTDTLYTAFVRRGPAEPIRGWSAPVVTQGFWLVEKSGTKGQHRRERWEVSRGRLGCSPADDVSRASSRYRSGCIRAERVRRVQHELVEGHQPPRHQQDNTGNLRRRPTLRPAPERTRPRLEI